MIFFANVGDQKAPICQKEGIGLIEGLGDKRFILPRGY